ncbi:DNA repair protein RecO [Candidatus Woesebacteria bacterium]|nr:DNA repair protein RecO [Candidatus Woesebacteria bacterium]
MRNKSFSIKGIVLKRVNVGETDRIVNLLTQEFGKMSCVAKGVRKIKSSKRAFLEPGNVINAFMIETKSLPIMIQATLIDDCSKMNQTLGSFRQLSQMLEIYEKLFVEQELEEEIFAKALNLRKKISSSMASSNFIKNTLTEIITDLGFQDPKESKYLSISDYISALSDKKMKSYDYLKVR